MAEDPQNNLTALTVTLVSAFVANNSVRKKGLPGLISSTHAALAALGNGKSAPSEEPVEQFTGAVTVRKSLANRDHILSMIDGKPYKSLKRHLSAKGLTPEDYRARYKLPATYPMVAPGYSEQRREVAKRLGLGRKPRGDSGGASQAAGARPKARRRPASKRASGVGA